MEAKEEICGVERCVWWQEEEGRGVLQQPWRQVWQARQVKACLPEAAEERR